MDYNELSEIDKKRVCDHLFMHWCLTCTLMDDDGEYIDNSDIIY